MLIIKINVKYMWKQNDKKVIQNNNVCDTERTTRGGNRDFVNDLSK